MIKDLPVIAVIMDRLLGLSRAEFRVYKKGIIKTGLMSLGLILIGAVQANEYTTILSQSNALGDDVDYLSVTMIEQLDESGYSVSFLIETLAALDSIADSNYGVQSFGLSLPGIEDLSSYLVDKKPKKKTTTDDFISGLPSGWSVQEDVTMSEFGSFDIRLSGKNKSRTTSLSFTINGVQMKDVDIYFFAAHVAGFNTVNIAEKENKKITKAFFGMEEPIHPVPLPASAWLFGAGLMGLFGAARRHQKH